MNNEELINLFYNYVNYTNKIHGLDDKLFSISNLDRESTIQTLKDNFLSLNDIVWNHMDHQIFLELMDYSNLHLYKDKINTLLNNKSFKSNLTVLFAREIIQNNTADVFKIFHNINTCKYFNNRFYGINTRKKAIIILIALSTFNLNEYNRITCIALNYVTNFKNDLELINICPYESINSYTHLRTIDSKIYLLEHLITVITSNDVFSGFFDSKELINKLYNLYEIEDNAELRGLIQQKIQHINLLYNSLYK